MAKFPTLVAEKVLAACGRRCCLCHKFCGTKMELHHAMPASDGGDSTYENCIPLCFDCHAEVSHYNEKHPKGRKFSAAELMQHRDHWYRIWGEYGGIQREGVALPEVDILSARLSKCGEGISEGKKHWSWSYWAEIYLNPRQLDRVSIPFHRCEGEIILPMNSGDAVLEEIAIERRDSSRRPDVLGGIYDRQRNQGQIVVTRPEFLRVLCFFQTPVPEGVRRGQTVVAITLPIAEADSRTVRITVPLTAIDGENYREWYYRHDQDWDEETRNPGV